MNYIFSLSFPPFPSSSLSVFISFSLLQHTHSHCTSGFISGLILLGDDGVVGGLYLGLGFLWMLLIPWGAFAIFLVSIELREQPTV